MNQIIKVKTIMKHNIILSNINKLANETIARNNLIIMNNLLKLKGCNLQHYNISYTWNSLEFNWLNINNNKIMLNNKIILKLLYNMCYFTESSNTLNTINNINKIIMSQPKIESSITNVNMKFYYTMVLKIESNVHNNYYLNLILNILNTLNINEMFITLLTKIYNNKIVLIQPLLLLYDYLNNEIIAKTLLIHNDNSKNDKSIKIKLYNMIPYINQNMILDKYVNHILRTNEINYNNIIEMFPNLDINKYYKLLTKELLIDILINKYLIGWILSSKGRIILNDSRTHKLMIYKGTMNNKLLLGHLFKRIFKLNYIPLNNTIYNLNIINKNGKYNIKVKFNWL